MNNLKEKGYSEIFKDIGPTSNNYSDMMNKIMKLYKINEKKDNGYEGARMVIKTEWEKYLEQEKRTGNKKENRRGKREQEGTKGNREQKKERKREPEEKEEEMKKTEGDFHSLSSKAGNFSHQLN